MMTKLCKDCRWFKEANIGEFGKFAECAAPQNGFRNTNDDDDTDQALALYVTGAIPKTPLKIRRLVYCVLQRKGSKLDAWLFRKCGPQGRWWTPRQ